MTKEKLAEAIGAVVDDLVAEAAEERIIIKKRKHPSWYRWAATVAAAALMLVVGGRALMPGVSDNTSSGTTTDTGTMDAPGTTGSDESGDAGTMADGGMEIADSTTGDAGASGPETGQPDGESSAVTEDPGFDFLHLLVAQAAEPEVDQDYGFDWSDWDAIEALEEANPVDDRFYQALQDFSFRTTAKLAEGQQAETMSNMLYSPLSLYYALAILAEGSEGATREELLDLMAISDPAQDGNGDSAASWLAEQSGNLYRRLYRDNEVGTFRIANSLWVDREQDGQLINWEQGYLDTVTCEYYASVLEADFAGEEAGEAMGQWIARQTEGLVAPEITPDPDQMLAILNTIYLQAEWHENDEFEEDLTAEDVFYRADGSQVTCEFMKQHPSCDDMSYYDGEGYVRASLWLKQTGYMDFILPDEGVDIAELLSSPERLAEAFTGGEETEARVIWQVPKFEFGMDGSLLEMLQALGLDTACDSARADFSGMTDSEISLSDVRQGTRISVNEKGVEAAAFTVLGLGMGGPSGEEFYMTLNRPFLYGIRSRDGVYSFIGVCMDPTITGQ